MFVRSSHRISVILYQFLRDRIVSHNVIRGACLCHCRLCVRSRLLGQQPVSRLPFVQHDPRLLGRPVQGTQSHHGRWNEISSPDHSLSERSPAVHGRLRELPFAGVYLATAGGQTESVQEVVDNWIVQCPVTVD